MLARSGRRCYPTEVFLPPLQPTLEAALRDASSDNPRFREPAARVLADATERPEEVLEALLRLADDLLGPIRAIAIAGLGEHPLSPERPEVLTLLRARFDDGHDQVRQASVRAAAHVDPAPDWLLDVLDDPRAEMRWQAVVAIGELGRTDDVDHVRARLDDEDPRVVCAAIETLADLADDPDAIAARLDHEDEDVRFVAAMTLAAAEDARGEPVLVQALASRERALAAAEALGAVAGPKGIAALAFTAERTFAPLLLRAAAGKALARRGDPRGESALDVVLRAWRADGRDYAIEAAGSLGLHGLLPALLRLVRRLRGADPRVLADTLEKLATHHEEARRGLDELASRGHLPAT